jgi:hypothetical protein
MNVAVIASTKKPARLAWRGDSIGYPDGGFPYNRDCSQSHMGIPGTLAPPNVSTMFPTWFRIHTLALMAEVLTDEEELDGPFRFTSVLSMGWHQPWIRNAAFLLRADRLLETGSRTKIVGTANEMASRNFRVRVSRAISSPRSVVRGLRARL